VQRVEYERSVVATDRHEALAIPQRELRDRHAACLLEGLLQERVRLRRRLLGFEVVRGLDVELFRYLVLLDESGDVDRLARAERELLEVLVIELDVVALLVLVAAHDVVPLDLVVPFRAPALVLDA